MAYVAPSTRSTGDLITAAIWNQDIVDNVVAVKALVDGAVGWGTPIDEYDATGTTYATSSTTYTNVDGTNMAFTITPSNSRILLFMTWNNYQVNGELMDIAYNNGTSDVVVAEFITGYSAIRNEQTEFLAEFISVTAGASITITLRYKARTATSTYASFKNLYAAIYEAPTA